MGKTGGNWLESDNTATKYGIHKSPSLEILILIKKKSKNLLRIIKEIKN